MTQYLAFGIGGTSLKYALLNNADEIIKHNKASASTDNLVDFLKAVYKIADQYQGQFERIAFNASGKVNTETNTAYFGRALSYSNGVNFQRLVGDRYHVPVGVKNDGKAAALAEFWLGELKGVSNGAVVIPEANIDGRTILDGRIWKDGHLQAGELSFMQIEGDKSGFERFSCTHGSTVRMTESINKSIENSDLKDGCAAFDAINNGNDQVLRTLERECKGVATIIFDIQPVVDLGKFVTGGGISARPKVTEAINKQYRLITNEIPFIAKMLTWPTIVGTKLTSEADIYEALYILLLRLNGGDE